MFDAFAKHDEGCEHVKNDLLQRRIAKGDSSRDLAIFSNIPPRRLHQISKLHICHSQKPGVKVGRTKSHMQLRYMEKIRYEHSHLRHPVADEVYEAVDSGLGQDWMLPEAHFVAVPVA